MSIQLKDAAKFFKGLDHQIDALNWLQRTVPKETLEIFAAKYRNTVDFTLTPNSWEGVCLSAKKAGAKYPEVVAAQWALESGWGKHTSGKNNYFGLKGSDSLITTKEFINGKFVAIKAGFLDFKDLESCIEYLVCRWYQNYIHFKGVNRAKDRNECAELLVKEGYATDPDYAVKLIQIMDRQLNIMSTGSSSFLPISPFSYQVTPSINYGELCLNQEARRFTQLFQCQTAVKLCDFLEKVKKEFGNKPVIITSGHRPVAINRSIGGASSSEHLFNAPDVGAVDFFIKGANIYDVEKYCDKNWPYSIGYGARKGFIHLGMRKTKQRIRWDY
jgi:hypothetical protein